MEYHESDFSPPAMTAYEPVSLPPSSAGKKEKKPSVFFIQSVISLILCLGILSLRLFSPGSFQTVKSWLITDEIGTYEEALETMVDSIFHGESFSDAMVVFCRDVIDAQDSH